jgi:hypothetical protein
MNPKKLMVRISLCAASMFTFAAVTAAQTSKTSGVYLTAADYEIGKLVFEGDCGSKFHKLQIHDYWNKPYIDVKHDSGKHRYSKSNLFGFRACDGHDYRFVSNLQYQILEAKELYIYGRDVAVPQGKGTRTVHEHYFSVGAAGQLLPLTLGNLKQAFPDNHKFHDSLDATFGAGQDPAWYDDFHKMFKVNRLLIASREKSP